jgi:hypothetical protein
MAVQIVVMGDMNESQRGRFLSFMNIRNIQLEGCTFQIVMEAYRELFCAPKSAIDNPSLRSSGAGGKAFCIVDDGEMDGTQGYWVEDEETGECGFPPEFEDIFWTFDDENFAWMSRPFRGRKLRRGTPKGRGKGKGSKGYSRFKSRFKGKGKGGFNHANQTTNDSNAWWGAPKGKGKGGKKGKFKGKGKPGGKPALAESGKGPTGQSHIATDAATVPPPQQASETTSQNSPEWPSESWQTYPWWNESIWFITEEVTKKH